MIRIVVMVKRIRINVWHLVRVVLLAFPEHVVNAFVRKSMCLIVVMAKRIRINAWHLVWVVLLAPLVCVAIVFVQNSMIHIVVMAKRIQINAMHLVGVVLLALQVYANTYIVYFAFWGCSVLTAAYFEIMVRIVLISSSIFFEDVRLVIQMDPFFSSSNMV